MAQRKCTLRSTVGGGKVDSINGHTYLYDDLNLSILAYLQFTIDANFGRKFFDDSIVNHCRDQLQKFVKIGEIRDKLNLSWGHWCDTTQRATDWQKIFQLGLRGLPRLPNDKARWVQERADHLRDREHSSRSRRLPRNTSLNTGAIRKAPKHAANSSAESKKQRTIGKPRSASKTCKSNFISEVSD